MHVVLHCLLLILLFIILTLNSAPVVDFEEIDCAVALDGMSGELTFLCGSYCAAESRLL